MDLRNAAAPKNAPNWRRTDLDLQEGTQLISAGMSTGRGGYLKENQEEDSHKQNESQRDSLTFRVDTCSKHWLAALLIVQNIEAWKSNHRDRDQPRRMTCDRHRRRGGGKRQDVPRLREV